jgi:TetR/AcrR family transcriptional repressor of bet genes
MGRISVRPQKRQEIAEAFALVLAQRGFAQSTIAAVADRAGISPGLIHHHFKDKEDLLNELVTLLQGRLAQRIQNEKKGAPPLERFIDAALRLDARSDLNTARCWVGIFAEAIRNPTLHRRIKRLMDAQLAAIQRMSGGRFSDHDAAAVLAFVIGALVFGALAPRRTAGFAAPALKKLVEALGGNL